MEDDGATMAVYTVENMAPALISVHPDGSYVVVAIGAGLRLFDLVKNKPVAVNDDSTPGHHGEAIRAISFNDGGSFFASAGDDKLVKLWNTESWSCIKTTACPLQELSSQLKSFTGRWSHVASSTDLVLESNMVTTELPIYKNVRYKAEPSGRRDSGSFIPYTQDPIPHASQQLRIPKKVTSVTFSKDSRLVLLADKFGAVYILPTAVTEQKDEPVQLLAHCCSIITDLEVSSDGKYVVTSDRDFKIRISVFPSDPLKGAHEIWSYCLGHTSFVTCTAFVGARSSGQQFLISGSGDSTVRLWDYENGKMLYVFDTAEVDELINMKAAEDVQHAVIGLSVAPDGSTVAVLIERFSGVLLLQYDDLSRTLKHVQSIILSEQVSPTSLAFDVDSRLWLVAGAAESIELGDQLVTPELAAAAEARAQTVAKTAIAHVRLIRKCASASVEDNSVVTTAYGLCPGESMPGGESLLVCLQGNTADAGKVAAAAEAAEQAMRKLMSKRQYTVEQRENRKRFRNDKKLENKEV